VALLVVACVTVFGAGVALGAIAVVSVVVRREDRRATIRDDAPGLASRGARRLIGFDRLDPGHQRERYFG
jgi:hypothetical protein